MIGLLPSIKEMWSLCKKILRGYFPLFYKLCQKSTEKCANGDHVIMGCYDNAHRLWHALMADMWPWDAVMAANVRIGCNVLCCLSPLWNFKWLLNKSAGKPELPVQVRGTNYFISRREVLYWKLYWSKAPLWFLHSPEIPNGGAVYFFEFESELSKAREFLCILKSILQYFELFLSSWAGLI